MPMLTIMLLMDLFIDLHSNKFRFEVDHKLRMNPKGKGL